MSWMHTNNSLLKLVYKKKKDSKKKKKKDTPYILNMVIRLEEAVYNALNSGYTYQVSRGSGVKDKTDPDSTHNKHRLPNIIAAL